MCCVVRICNERVDEDFMPFAIRHRKETERDERSLSHA